MKKVITKSEKSSTKAENRAKKTFNGVQALRKVADKATEQVSEKMKKARMGQLIAFDEKMVEEDILREAKILKKPIKTVKLFAPKVAGEVTKWTKRRAAVTEGDINRKIAKEIERYDADLAYVFGNRGKII